MHIPPLKENNFLNYLNLIATITENERLFGLDSQTFIQAAAHLLNIVALVVILTWLLNKPVKNFLKNRAERINNDIESAKAAKTEAENLKAEYDAKLQDIEIECEQLLGEARKKATEMQNAIVADAKTEADRLKSLAEKAVEGEWVKAKTEMRDAIIDTSLAISAKVIGENFEPVVTEKLLDESLKEVEAQKWQN